VLAFVAGNKDKCIEQITVKTKILNCWWFH